MPLIIPQDIPAFGVLQNENIFVMSSRRAQRQDIRPIEIAIFNLMPTKIQTESQLLRLLANSPLQVKITFITTQTYASKNTPKTHLERFYETFDRLKNRYFDGMIITGAPIETMAFEEVAYWDEFKEILDFAQTHVNSTLYICWGAMAGLYYHYGIQKYSLENKAFGVFSHTKCADVLFTGCDDEIAIPHSRHTGVDEVAILRCEKLRILCQSDAVGAGIIKSCDNKKIFIIGHLEYDKDTLKNEYERDKAKGLAIQKPKNYFDTTGNIRANWKAGASLIFSNWLNHYVYQITPYNITSLSIQSQHSPGNDHSP
ncbi:homoserine O-succinyltransferase [Helicobacter sp. 11S02596-1]|uniref:homoserine O-succinyltransferase n=1 Tax=Helicobacter sp. 11S02596-1 TaxID=1476194 RepID=UPI000BA7573A|nr:homoserine O-succinyltransferase [Helicobacter sp. 11S02596-1]PAF44839.1 homoserine O-succinyltransferase [Helicobacter sp. 11S02596-1]